MRLVTRHPFALLLLDLVVSSVLIIDSKRNIHLDFDSSGFPSPQDSVCSYHSSERDLPLSSSTLIDRCPTRACSPMHHSKIQLSRSCRGSSDYRASVSRFSDPISTSSWIIIGIAFTKFFVLAAIAILPSLYFRLKLLFFSRRLTLILKFLLKLLPTSLLVVTSLPDLSLYFVLIGASSWVT